MRSSATISAIFTLLTLAGSLLPAHGQTPAEFSQTAAFAAAHQNKDGGFAAKAGELSSLGATNSALRVLKHVGGSVPDILGCIKFVKACRDASGGFAPMPGGKPGVVITAIGLMAASELKIADPAMIKEATDYLGTNAKSFEEVRMAIAGLEAVHGTSPDFSKWNDQLQGMRKPDGTWGEGPEQAYATGGAGAAVLRMGMKLDNRDAVISALKAGQRPGRRLVQGRRAGRPGSHLPHHAGESTCSMRGPTSSACWRSLRAAGSPTAATQASRATAATWAERTRPRS